MKEEGNETVTNYHALKLKTKDKLEKNLKEKVVTKYNKLNHNLTETKETIINKVK